MSDGTAEAQRDGTKELKKTTKKTGTFYLDGHNVLMTDYEEEPTRPQSGPTPRPHPRLVHEKKDK